jgi:muconolactone delta-isomerase
MKYMVTVSFAKENQNALAPHMAAEQAHVGDLLGKGVIESINIAVDRSRVWLVMQGESQDRIQQEMKAFPLYPYMDLDLAPLRELQLPR